VREWVYRPVINTALTLFRGLDFRFDMRGVDNIPSTGAAVLAANHVSYFDFMFVGLPPHRRGKRLVRFMAKQSVFDHPISGPLMRGMHHIPVDRTAGAAAFRHALRALGDGELIGIFPEQTISRSFMPRRLKTGAARLALDAHVPLIPIVTWGGHRVWTTGRRPQIRRHVPVSIWVDRPLPIDATATPADVTERLGNRLRELVEDVVTAYPDQPRTPGDWWWPAHVGGGAPTPELAADAEFNSIQGRRR